jgi:hypothetical protein
LDESILLGVALIYRHAVSAETIEVVGHDEGELRHFLSKKRCYNSVGGERQRG